MTPAEQSAVIATCLQALKERFDDLVQGDLGCAAIADPVDDAIRALRKIDLTPVAEIHRRNPRLFAHFLPRGKPPHI